MKYLFKQSRYLLGATLIHWGFLLAQPLMSKETIILFIVFCRSGTSDVVKQREATDTQINTSN